MAVVVGYVRSPEGRAAVRSGAAEAKLRDLRLVIVHSSEGGRKETAEEVLAYRKDLEQLESRLKSAGVDAEVHERVMGNSPAVDLVEVADESGADLIVIGIRRRSPVGKLVLGSNAQEIFMAATCPVLAVKASDEDVAAGGEPLSNLGF